MSIDVLTHNGVASREGLPDDESRGNRIAYLLPLPRRANFAGAWHPVAEPGDTVSMTDGPCLHVRPEHVDRLAPRTLSAMVSGVDREGFAFDAEGIRYEVRVSRAAVDVFKLSDAAAQEAYSIAIEEGRLRVAACTKRGLLHAGRTLRQLLDLGEAHRAADGRVPMPCGEITDWPDLPNRGVMLDVSRDRVPQLGFLLRWIDDLAERKLNQLQLYTEHTFAFTGHEAVWAHATPLTPADIHTVDAYCADRGIELVANQNTFGHMERWLKHEPYRGLAETLGEWTTPFGHLRNWPATLCPSDPGSIALVKDLLAQLQPHFTSPWVNIGCDETFDLGQGRSEDRCREVGLGHVYFDFVKQVIDVVRDSGRRTMFWGDIVLNHPELISEVPGDVVALNWGYEGNHPFDDECPRFARAGVPFYVCPSTCSFVGITGRPSVGMTNLLRSMRAGRDNGAIGVLITIWGDYGHWQPAGADAVGLTYGPALAWYFDGNYDVDPAAAASRFAFGDPGGRTGEAFWRMGQANLELNIKAPNALGWTMIRDAEPVIDRVLTLPWLNVGPFTDQGLDAAEQALDDAVELMAGSGAQRGPGQTAEAMREEFDVTIEMARHAVTNLRSRIAEGVEYDAELADATRRRAAIHLREHVIKPFVATWHRRSRAGGLTDALGSLRRRLTQYEASSSSSTNHENGDGASISATEVL